MHPLSPHAPARLAAAGISAGRAARVKTRSSWASRSAGDPLDALAQEIHGKLVHGSAAAKAHVAADELTLRRPRRPSAQRASFRTPPTQAS